MENKLARILRNTGPARFFLPISIALIIMGFLLLRMTPSKYAETQGTVTNVTQHTNEDGEEQYDITFEYTVDGKKYTSEYLDLVESMDIGANVTVYYNPDDPQSTSNTKHTGLISYVMMGAGTLGLFYGIYATINAFKKDKELDERTAAARGMDSVPEIIPVSKDQLTEYYVLFDGKSLKPGYIIENANRKVVYEAPMTKNAAIGNRIFTFTNHLTGRTFEHEVGHTTTTTLDNEIFSERSWFKFDGKNIWDDLHDQGIRIDTDIHSIFPRFRYTVAKDGRFFATIETSSKYVHEEDEAEHKIAIPVGRYYYRCWTNSDNLDLLFLTVFAISETEQTVVE